MSKTKIKSLAIGEIKSWDLPSDDELLSAQ